MRPDIKSTQLGGVANLALVASVKSGFIPGADTFTYDRRLEALFKTLMAIRLGARESQRHASPFPDAVGRWGLLHSFRYALVPPRIVWPSDPFGARDPGASAWRLYLNVAFDGGWEPYMRVIHRDLGYLLDTIFCNCDGYPLSTEGTFDEYCRWVRAHEVPAGIFYAESAASVLDGRYLEEAERRMRSEPDAVRAQRAVAALSLQPPDDTQAALARLQAAGAQAMQEVVGNHLRALKGLYDLRTLYAENPDRDDRRLLQFAQKAMPEFARFLALKRQEPALAPYKELVDWLLDPLPAAPRTLVRPAPPASGQVQPGLLEGYDGATHGCLLLLRVTDAAKARRWIGALPEQTRRRQAMARGPLFWNIAFSAGGLRALGQAAETVDLFPQEFVEGMEARAGLLGDVRGNHPEHWRRPRRHGPGPAVEIDLASVDAVVQWRLAAPDVAGAGMHPLLQEMVDALAAGDHGLQVLAAEPMRSYPDAARTVKEHFGFRDGLSQPQPVFAEPAPHASPHMSPQESPAASANQPRFDDTVHAGEIFLGHPGDRDAQRFPDRPVTLMDNGSFLVVRKLRQHVGRWQAVLDAAARRHDAQYAARPPAEQAAARDRMAAMMMGRRHDGTPTLDPPPGAGNDFDYAADPQGSRCPFQSHVRRANPRLPAAKPSQKMPRLLRRGMSYGPRLEPAAAGGPAADAAAERGLYFMAYCGSLAEQFEIIQRWMAGGNSSGVHASHSDPLLGVPQPGVRRTFQWLGEDGQVMRVDLGDEPITELQWGLYLFAPSLEGLRVLAQEPAAPAAAPASRPAAAPADPGEDYDPAGPAFDRRKLLLQGRREDKDAFWQLVRDQGGRLQTAYGLLEARKPEVLEVLRDGGTTHSVCGYGRRFAGTLGEGFLGLDDPRHRELAVDTGIKKAIAAIDEQRAFDKTLAFARRRITDIVARLTGLGQAPAIDILRLCDDVVADLCREWWGLPDEQHMRRGGTAWRVEKDDETAMCPRDFVFVARHNFGAHPSPHERHRGTTRGKAIEAAVRAWLKDTPTAGLPELSGKIHRALHGKPDGDDIVPWTIAGTMLGFGPSTIAHFALVMREWVEPGQDGGTSLWDLQVALLAEGTAADTHAAAERVLRGPLVAQMRREPVPGILWRERPGSTCAAGDPEPPKLALGLHGLMDDPDAEALMFGGELDENDRLFGVHACPGHGMALGVLMGLVAALVLAGTLRRTPSPTILMVLKP